MQRHRKCNKGIIEYSFKPNITTKYKDCPKKPKCDPISRNVESEVDKYSFIPIINRGPRVRKKNQNESIGDYLYKDSITAKNSLMSKKIEKTSPITKLNKNSEKIIKQMRNAIFKKIFTMIDSNNTGTIKNSCLENSRKFYIHNRFTKRYSDVLQS